MISTIGFFTLFSLYNYNLFHYTKNVFHQRMFNQKIFLLCSICNSLSFLILQKNHINLSHIMILFAVLLVLEFQCLYKEKLIKSILCSLVIIVPFSSFNFIVYFLYSFYFNLNNILTPPTFIQLCSSTTLMVALVIFFYLNKLTSFEFLKIINTSFHNTIFCIVTLVFLFLYLVYNLQNYYLENPYSYLIFFQFKVGLLTTCIFVILIIYSVVLSKLALFENRSKKMEALMSKKYMEQETLENIANLDEMSGCFKRGYGISYLEETISLKPGIFSIVFFDLDGLKYVNDTFGHQEGDVYIKSAVNIFKNSFEGHMVARMGGDEFMVVLRGEDEFFTEKCALCSLQALEAASKMSNQPYPMSTSYGLIDIKPSSTLSPAEMIAIVDQRMYAFKSSRKTSSTFHQKNKS